MAQAIAGVGAILVGLVFAPGDARARRSQASISVRSISSSGRTSPSLRHRQNAGEAGEPGAAQDPVEHGFGLIGSGVTGCDAVDRAGCDQFGVESLPDVARRFFQVAVDGWDVGLAKMERKLEGGSQLCDEFGVRDAMPRRECRARCGSR